MPLCRSKKEVKLQLRKEIRENIKQQKIVAVHGKKM
jgi:hypothetical protein